jgi:hypothetical protein
LRSDWKVPEGSDGLNGDLSTGAKHSAGRSERTGFEQIAAARVDEKTLTGKVSNGARAAILPIER